MAKKNCTKVGLAEKSKAPAGEKISGRQKQIEQNRYAMACASCRIAFFVFYTKNSGK